MNRSWSDFVPPRPSGLMRSPSRQARTVERSPARRSASSTGASSEPRSAAPGGAAPAAQRHLPVAEPAPPGTASVGRLGDRRLGSARWKRTTPYSETASTPPPRSSDVALPPPRPARSISATRSGAERHAARRRRPRPAAAGPAAAAPAAAPPGGPASTAGGQPPAPAAPQRLVDGPLEHLLPRRAAARPWPGCSASAAGMDLPQRRQDLEPQPVARQRAVARWSRPRATAGRPPRSMRASRARVTLSSGRTSRPRRGAHAEQRPAARARRPAGRGPSRPGRWPCARWRSGPARARAAPLRRRA